MMGSFPWRPPGRGYSTQSSDWVTTFHQILDDYVLFFSRPSLTLPATANALAEAEMLLLKQTSSCQ
jgi:hypothetical protein